MALTSWVVFSCFPFLPRLGQLCLLWGWGENERGCLNSGIFFSFLIKKNYPGKTPFSAAVLNAREHL